MGEGSHAKAHPKYDENYHFALYATNRRFGDEYLTQTATVRLLISQNEKK